MDTTLTQRTSTMVSNAIEANSPSSSQSSVTAVETNSDAQISTQSAPVERITATSSIVNLFDGFTSRVSGDRGQNSTASTPSSSTSSVGGGGGLIGAGGSIASLTSIGSLGTTANAFYSSIGLAFNSITSPITAAAAAAQATTAEAAAVVVAAASALTNHLSSPTSGTPPNMDVIDDDEDCDDDDEEEEVNDGRIAASTPKKTWSQLKTIVNDLRKQLSHLSSMVPTNVQFRKLSDGRKRCYFLGQPPNSWETTLMFTDVDPNPSELVDATSMNTDEITDDVSSNGISLGVGRASGGDNIMIGNISNGIGSTEILGWGRRSNRSTPVVSPAASPPMSPSSRISGFFPGIERKRLQSYIILQHPMPNLSTANGSIWSREYQLLQERKRLSTWGMNSYELHHSSGKIVFPCLNDLYQCVDTGFNSFPLFPTQLRTCPQWAALDPQICPQNSDLVAYISGCDIWVKHTISGHEERLTFAHDGRRSFSDDPLSAGVPSYVMQEEFSRFLGYWWQPDTGDEGTYRIVYEEVDESDVCLYTFPSSQAIAGKLEEYRFPRTGTPNAKSKLKLIQFSLNVALQITDVWIKDLPYSLSVVFPWLEYIVRVGWTPDSQYVWMQGLNRRQQRLDLILIPFDNFCESYYGTTNSSPNNSQDHSWMSPYCSDISPLQVIYSESSDTWINVNDLLYFLDITETTVTFLWGSEESGFRHLYLVTSSLSSVTVNGIREPNNETESDELSGKKIEENTSTSSLNSRGSPVNMDTQHVDLTEGPTLQPRIINKVALTSGEWEVLGRILWVDKPQQLVYFLGLRDSPLEKHLYVVSLQRPEHIRLLTEPGYSYLIEFDEDCQLMLQIYCNIHRFPSCRIMRVTQTYQSGGVNGIQLSLMGYLQEGGKPESKYCPQIYKPQLPCGEIVYAMVFKPHNFELGIKYPTVLNVYGGPEVQTVNNTFKGKHQLRMHMLAAQGYCVISIDSRGSRHRGTVFENYIRCRMGQVELTDQVDALKALSDKLGYIDMNRIAIHGWSYGGYLSLMALVQHPDIFKIAIAGAPVTNWEYYDTGYTERYMDLPHNNKRGYAAGSVLNYIPSFPDEENRLLLIHGLIDENVHFYHTSQLITALNKANKPYALHIFPDERHSLRNVESNKNYETRLLSFLQNL